MNNKVYVIGVKTYDKALIKQHIEKCWNELSDDKPIVSTGQKVLIKPNLAGAFTPEQAVTTHPDIIETVVDLVIRDGGIPVVGDIPTVGEIAFEATGFFDIQKKGKFKVLESKYKSIDVLKGSRKVNVAKDLFEADVFISLPKIKTHVLTGMSGAIKNTFGLMEPKDRKITHCTEDLTEFSNILVDVYKVRIPDLVIADAILAMEGIGPTHGIPRKCNTVLVGKNGAAVDIAASKLMGYDLNSVPTCRISIEQNMTDEGVDFLYFGSEIKEWNSFKRVPVFEGKERIRFVKLALGRLAVKEAGCTKCGICSKCCPARAIRFNPWPVFDAKKCVYCFCCLEMCPTGSILTEKKIN